MVLFVAVAVLNAQNADLLKIVILEGDGAFNDIKHEAAHVPIVELRNEADAPVPGVKVTFTLPFSGPGGAFSDGTRSCTVTTDEHGQAKALEFKPNKEEGRFNIKVVAEMGGQQSEAVIGQSNTLAGGEIAQHKGGNKKLWLLLLVAGGAGGAFAGLHGGSHSAGTASAGPTTITVGGIAVGGPH